MSKTAAILAAFCAAHGGEREHRLPDRTRVDCLTATHAVEVEESRFWAESVGQTLHYGLLSGRTPMIVLVIDRPVGCRHLARLRRVVDDYGLGIVIETAGPGAADC